MRLSNYIFAITLSAAAFVSNSHATSINNLPDDVLAVALTNLSPQDIGRCEQVSKKWKSVIEKKQVWEQLAQAHLKSLGLTIEKLHLDVIPAEFYFNASRVAEIKKAHAPYNPIKSFRGAHKSLKADSAYTRAKAIARINRDNLANYHNFLAHILTKTNVNYNYMDMEMISYLKLNDNTNDYLWEDNNFIMRQYALSKITLEYLGDKSAIDVTIEHLSTLALVTEDPTNKENFNKILDNFIAHYSESAKAAKAALVKEDI